MKKENIPVPTSDAKARVARAEARTIQAEIRTQQAQTRIERAEARTEKAKTRAEAAETRAEQAESRTEHAKTRTEQAEIRSEQAETALEECLHPEEKNQHSQVDIHQLLTPRQCEILQLIAEGQNTKEIAHSLNLSPKTVEYHRLKLMKALNLHDIPGLVRFALKVGLIARDY